MGAFPLSKQSIELFDMMTPLGLGENDPARTRRHDGVEIIRRPFSIERIDPHPQAVPILLVRGQEFGDHPPRFGLVRDRHRVLEVEDDDIRRAARRLFHLAGAVARGKQP